MLIRNLWGCVRYAYQSPTPALTWDFVQEIAQAKNELRAKGVSVD